MLDPDNGGGPWNVVSLQRGDELYTFLYDDQSVLQVLQALGRFASNPDLSFTWYDAALLSRKVRELNRQEPGTAA